MATWVDAVIVSLIALGSVVLIGILGYFADKSGTGTGYDDKIGEPLEREAEHKGVYKR